MKFSDRGLVQNGYTNLKLINSLFWVVDIAFVVHSYGTFPLSQQLKGGFPENSIKGQICMKLDFQLDKNNVKYRVKQGATHFLIMVFTLLKRRNIGGFVKDHNLSQSTFAQFGGKQNRNLFTASQNIFYLLVCISLAFVDNGLIMALEWYSGKIDKHTQFIIHNCLWVAYIDLFFGLFVPLKHIIQSRESLPELWWESKRNESPKFYVRRHSIHPRRYSSINSDESIFLSLSKLGAKDHESVLDFENKKWKRKSVRGVSNKRNVQSHSLKDSYIESNQYNAITPLGANLLVHSKKKMRRKRKKRMRITVLPKIQEEETMFQL